MRQLTSKLLNELEIGKYSVTYLGRNFTLNKISSDEIQLISKLGLIHKLTYSESDYRIKLHFNNGDERFDKFLEPIDFILTGVILDFGETDYSNNDELKIKFEPSNNESVDWTKWRVEKQTYCVYCVNRDGLQISRDSAGKWDYKITDLKNNQWLINGFISVQNIIKECALSYGDKVEVKDSVTHIIPVGTTSPANAAAIMEKYKKPIDFEKADPNDVVGMMFPYSKPDSLNAKAKELVAATEYSAPKSLTEQVNDILDANEDGERNKHEDIAIAFHKKISDWLTPKGFVETYSNHPLFDEREFHFIKDGIRVINVIDSSGGEYCYLQEDIFGIAYSNSRTISLKTERLKILTPELDSIMIFLGNCKIKLLSV